MKKTICPHCQKDVNEKPQLEGFAPYYVRKKYEGSEKIYGSDIEAVYENLDAATIKINEIIEFINNT